MTGLLLHDAEVAGTRIDVRITEGTVTEIGSPLARRPGEEEIDAAGGALIAGLTGLHLQLHALAAVERSVRCGPPAVHDRRALAAALSAYLAPSLGPGSSPHRVAVGHPADLVLLDNPVSQVLVTPNADAVRATLIDGHVVHGG